VDALAECVSYYFERGEIDLAAAAADRYLKETAKEYSNSSDGDSRRQLKRVLRSGYKANWQYLSIENRCKYGLLACIPSLYSLKQALSRGWRNNAFKFGCKMK